MEYNIKVDNLYSDILVKAFNTPTGKQVEESIKKYLNNAMNVCEDMKEFGEELEQLNKVYYLASDKMRSSVKKGDS